MKITKVMRLRRLQSLVVELDYKLAVLERASDSNKVLYESMESCGDIVFVSKKQNKLLREIRQKQHQREEALFQIRKIQVSFIEHK